MMKYPWMQFFVDDWLSDEALAICSPATRGIWADILCVMHKSDRSGVITATREQLARLGRCSTVELCKALDELKATATADVTLRNSTVTLVNRRMKREATIRESVRLRVKRHRETVGVTPSKQTYLDTRVQNQSQSLSPTKGEKALAKLEGSRKDIAARFEHLLGIQWVNDAGKWVNRVKASPSKSARVVAEVESAVKEGRVNTTPAQYAEQIWKEFR